jgi:hypothetical protein
MRAHINHCDLSSAGVRVQDVAMGGAPGHGGGVLLAAGDGGVRPAGERDGGGELAEVRVAGHGGDEGPPAEVSGPGGQGRPGRATAGARVLPGRRRQGPRHAVVAAQCPDHVTKNVLVSSWLVTCLVARCLRNVGCNFFLKKTGIVLMKDFRDECRTPVRPVPWTCPDQSARAVWKAAATEFPASSTGRIDAGCCSTIW